MRHLFLILIALLLWACQSDTLDAPARGGLTVSLRCDQLTRATMAGEDQYNENAIREAWVFLFATGSQTAVYAQKVTLTGGATQFTLTIPNDDIDQTIFPSGATACDIVVLANYHGTETFATLPTRAHINELALTADFKGSLTGQTVDKNNFQLQPDFVMSGTSTVALTRGTPYTAATSVALRRAAAKVDFSVHIDRTIKDDDDQLWEPDYEHVDIQLMHANSAGRVDGGGTQQTLFDYNRRYGTANDVGQDPQSSVGPFYSYPMAWTDDGTFQQPSTPYAIITVPFRLQTGSTTQYDQYRYKVRLLWDKLEPNHWYTEMVNIHMLGALHKGEEVPIADEDLSFSIVPWITVPAEVTINDTRYLNVTYSGSVDVQETNAYNRLFGLTDTEAHNIVMLDNQEDAAIAYTSSPAITLAGLDRRFEDFTDARATIIHDSPTPSGSGTEADPWRATLTGTSGNTQLIASRQIEVYLKDGTIHVHHPLDNRDSNTDASYDVSAFYIHLRVRHAGDTHDKADGSNYADIYILQRPAISIVADYTGTSYGTTGSCTFVNGYNDGASHNSLGSAGSSPNATNTNWNEYVITISRLNPQSTYILSDPRVDRENAVAYYTLAAQAPYVTGYAADGTPTVSTDTRALMYYRPTRTDDAHMIAPSYRVASSHGAVNPISQTNANYRMATFQENGRPAGRWRVPTAAEVQFAMQLSADGKIPYLYGSSGSSTDYWVAGGYVTIDRTGATATVSDLQTTATRNQETYVRGVYDEWYWRYPLTDAQKTVFTWGDMQ